LKSKEKTISLYSRRASTWMKGLAIIMIVLSHFAEWWAWFFAEEGIRELLRDGISRCGPYGVAIFLLFSGYGLVKSAGEKRIDWRFVAKRFVSVYIPYLAIVTVINLLGGGFDFKNVGDFGKFLYGDDFWYMTVLFSFYLAFMTIWFMFTDTHKRAVLMGVFTYWYSRHLYMTGEQDFWYISNIAFLIGTLLALYESYIKKIIDRLGIILTVLFGAGSVMVVRAALYSEKIWEIPYEEAWSRISAIIVFTLFIACLAAVWKWYDPILPVFGRYSLYFYLTHTFLFMWTINNGNIHEEMRMRILFAAGIIIVVSLVLGLLIDILMKPLQNVLKKEKNKDGIVV